MSARPSEDTFFRQVFNTRLFARTLSYREFITSLSLALLCLALYTIIDYYGNEDWAIVSGDRIERIFLIVCVALNHVFYRIEHRRPNNFIGRNFHDYIFIVIWRALLTVYQVLNGGTFISRDIGIGGVIAGLLGIVVVVALFEVAVAIFKRLLRIFKWQVL